jgi:excisionase family DNA binding protein
MSDFRRQLDALWFAMSKNLSVSIAAELLRSPARSVRSFLAVGYLAGVPSPHHWRIPRPEIDRLVAEACEQYGVESRPLAINSLLTVQEVSKVLNRSPRTIRLAAERHEIPAFKLGRAWRFWRVDIEHLATGRELKRVS